MIRNISDNRLHNNMHLLHCQFIGACKFKCIQYRESGPFNNNKLLNLFFMIYIVCFEGYNVS